MIEFFKILNGFEGIEEQLFFRRHISNNRGHSMKVYKDNVNSDVLKDSFANRILEQWNRLTEKVISAKCINLFKNKVHKYLRVLEMFKLG